MKQTVRIALAVMAAAAGLLGAIYYVLYNRTSSPQWTPLVGFFVGVVACLATLVVLGCQLVLLVRLIRSRATAGSYLPVALSMLLLAGGLSVVGAATFFLLFIAAFAGSH